jgi:hypothetical protein
MLHKTTDIDVKLIILYVLVDKASNIFDHPVVVSWQIAKNFEQTSCP